MSKVYCISSGSTLLYSASHDISECVLSDHESQSVKWSFPLLRRRAPHVHGKVTVLRYMLYRAYYIEVFCRVLTLKVAFFNLSDEYMRWSGEIGRKDCRIDHSIRLPDH